MKILGCPPLGEDRVKHIYESIDGWLRSPALSALVKSFGSEMPSHLDTIALGVWLLEFSERWDFRKLQHGAEGARWRINDSSLTEAQRNITIESARELGLIGQETPNANTYDFMWVLGGARLSNLLRPRLAARLITEHDLRCRMIALLSSAREIVDEAEREATNTYAPEAKTEFDLLNKGTEIEFNIDLSFTEERHDDVVNPNESWVIRTYDKIGNLPPLLSMSAPSSRPSPLPANSADTYNFFFDHVHVPQGSSFLLISSQIYVPYQQLEAIRTVALRHNIVIETVGFPLEWSGNLQGMTGPSNYLQEIRSTIQSANRFFSAFPR